MRKDKIGFDTPQRDWFKEKSLNGLITDILYSDSFANRKIIMPSTAKALYRKHLSDKIDISKDIWKWLNLELWYREFID